MNRRQCLLLAAQGGLAFFAASRSPAEAIDDQPVEPSQPTSTPPPSTLPTLWIIGDSTVKVGTPGQRGWGDELPPFFDPAKIRVINRAIGGRSTRTFLREGRWTAILNELKRGDVVLVQFGHNDASPINEDPPIKPTTRSRGVIRDNSDASVEIVNILTGELETVRSYGWYLRQIATSAIERGAMPIICSPIPRNQWTAAGNVIRTTDSWSRWAKDAATQAGASFIDLNEIIARHYEQLGPAQVKALFADQGTHTNREGAACNARAVVAGLRGLASDPLHFAWSEVGQAVPRWSP